MNALFGEHRARNIQRLKAPRAAAVAGILFALLFAASISLIRLNIPADFSGEASWISTGYRPLRIALVLMPFAVIAFLWFVGVIRDRLGEQEDQFFATVFFGSSLLFLAMVCVSMAIAGGILVAADGTIQEGLDRDSVALARAVMLQISNVYALRMAAVFMVSVATIWLRTGVMPRRLALATYVLALLLLLVVSLNLWVVLIFPAWVFSVSVFILTTEARSSQQSSPLSG
ncbi:MAG: hypothetical protein NZ528_17250 [Caldilineales bacterium]|nr:hypothetical protein [Caldilineales bacterium]MDW8317145.1 hypothetical protein [Anaerolineae bacterium]